MKNSIAQHVIRIPVIRTPRRLLSAELNSMHHASDQLSNGISLTIQVWLGRKVTEILKRKLSMGAKLLQVGGAAKIFKQNFGVLQGEKSMQAFQCYLSTTTGPIAGFLFVTTDEVAFCSEKLLRISTLTGELIKIHYNVLIPLIRIKNVRESKDVKRPSKKYVENIKLKCLQQAISQAHQ